MKQFNAFSPARIPDEAEELAPDVEGGLGLFVAFKLMLEMFRPCICCLIWDILCPDMAAWLDIRG